MTTKTLVGVRIDSELLDRVKNCVFWSPGQTLVSVVEVALASYLRRAEKARGGAFPQRTSALRQGRPVK